MTLTTSFNFDEIINRRGTNCAKYDIFDDPDLVSMWVADMDFKSPPEIAQAIQERAAHGVFGYTMDMPRLREILVQRMADLYNWQIEKDHILFLPGVVSAFNVAVAAFGQLGDNVLMNTPIYPPMLYAPANHGQASNVVPLTEIREGQRLRYEIDFDAFEAAINEKTKTFLLCSPHNPVGRVWTRDELTRMAEICEKHDLIIISDDIHCDLVFDGYQHIPIAALSPEISKRTITLMAPSKSFNVPSLGFSFAVIQDEAVKQKFHKAEAGIVPHVGALGYTAGLAAYEYGDTWLRELLPYLEGNRNLVAQFVDEYLPGVSVTCPEGTYLSWLDTRQYTVEPDPNVPFAGWIDTFFMQQGKVALNGGAMFGDPGKGYVRLNFAMPRSELQRGLDKMRVAIEQS